MDKCAETSFTEAIVEDSILAEPAGMAPSPLYFIMTSGGIPGAMLQLAASGTRIGRAGDNGLALPESSISRYHAYLGGDAEGNVRLTDLGSTNGTFVNGRRLPPQTPVQLRDGDRVRFGSSLCVKFVRPNPADERFHREMFERTIRDPLTGLYNRTYFLGEVGALGDRGALHGLGLAVLMIDVDHFKRINDAHGHPAGDRVLREIASVLRQAMRGEDLIARYGGEEFVAALPVAAPDGAAERVERIRANVAGRRLTVDGRSIRATVSVGVAYAPASRNRSVPALLAAADQGLYQAKSAGRNRVVFGSESWARLSEARTEREHEIDSTPFD